MLTILGCIQDVCPQIGTEHDCRRNQKHRNERGQCRAKEGPGLACTGIGCQCKQDGRGEDCCSDCIRSSLEASPPEPVALLPSEADFRSHDHGHLHRSKRQKDAYVGVLDSMQFSFHAQPPPTCKDTTRQTSSQSKTIGIHQARHVWSC